MEKCKIVVVGNGMVGYKFCEKAVNSPIYDDVELVVFGEEPRPAYDRVHLSAYFGEKTLEELTMAPKEWYTDNGIKLYLGDSITEINPEQKTVTSHRGVSETYDYLIMATGSGAFVPNIQGVGMDGIFVYRTIEDLDLMKAYAQKASRGVVIGGGLLGLEAAKALLDLGIKDAHVVEFAPRLMPRQIDDKGSSILEGKLNELGITVHCSKNTARFSGESSVTGLEFHDGQFLEADMVVISAGIRPRDEVAGKAGLEVGPRGGILVNEQMQTSDENIFAIGECALYDNMIYGLVAPGYEMSEVAFNSIAAKLDKPAISKKVEFTGFDMSTKLKLIGVDVASFGNAFIEEPDCQTIVYENKAKGIYKRVNIDTHNKKLLGGILIGDAEQYNMLQQVCINELPIPADPEDMILGSRGGEDEGAGVMALPDSALICSCEAVSKGDIIEKINDGCRTIDEIKKSTKACTGCAGCVPLVQDLVSGVLKEQGIIERKVICEHFDHTRQELLSLVKMKGHLTFDEVLKAHGTGDGCEKCQPAVSSILASLWNDNVLEKGRDVSQDSNDRFLANIQRGGTYSVVPRIPGGEITPDKLIVIGEVAKKYGLYTKITGGQRIDMFGAHVGDLPKIWEELVAAGFESGHAYGKALRTVKSCVGTTWCRFGVQDAVSFAIEVENRYKGLRSPHKLKSAVSGCTRECAEAQSKDFGIIATEAGWNLYVCGNGGTRPRHADLLATDLSSEDCIKYIDRFLMFYIRTAEPLQRTAAWLDKLEGGISYLKSVVIDNVLGINDELEAEMDSLVGKYKCEWKEVVETPELRKRFTHFVNAPEVKDPNVELVPMRDQVKAADWNA
ncbi:nitrite reductase large subunit NirB [Jiulongibacter sp. NS-SX5]|uniref:nitrite reductase large subunit NirB n=1 Tax=Jiulongibacter sp. NS-SX5 TaxID=3463854 RepID=UPI004058DBB4